MSLQKEESMRRLAPALLLSLLTLAFASPIALAQTTGDTPTAGTASATGDASNTGDTSTAPHAPTSRDRPIYHDIYITLKDHSQIAVQKQLRLGKEYLSVHKHPGEISFTATVLATGLKRHQQVPYLHNETDFDVAFHLVFANARAHDQYQVSYAHVHEFIPKSKSNWQELRVFDSVKR